MAVARDGGGAGTQKKIVLGAALRNRAVSKVCDKCNSKCVDEPSEAEPLLLRCTRCNGDGCGECEDGYVRVTGCPYRMIPEDVADLFKYYDDTKAGLPPVHGGGLDQTQSFINACRIVRAEDAYWESRAFAKK
jgi:hypothetical protein